MHLTLVVQKGHGKIDNVSPHINQAQYTSLLKFDKYQKP